MYAMKVRFVLLSLLLTLSASAQWRAVAPGVDYRHIVRDTIDVHVARIDMKHPNTIVIATDRTERGLTVSEFAKKAKAIAAINGDYFDLGVCEAMNLDGGGSSAMWIGDAIVNRPSDGAERKVGNHLAVVAAADYSGCPRISKR